MSRGGKAHIPIGSEPTRAENLAENFGEACRLQPEVDLNAENEREEETYEWKSRSVRRDIYDRGGCEKEKSEQIKEKSHKVELSAEKETKECTIHHKKQARGKEEQQFQMSGFFSIIIDRGTDDYNPDNTNLGVFERIFARNWLTIIYSIFPATIIILVFVGISVIIDELFVPKPENFRVRFPMWLIVACLGLEIAVDIQKWVLDTKCK